MPRARGSKDYLSLTKGLITEASPLAFPEESTSDELNFILETGGVIRQRRKGFEALVTITETLTNATVENALYWLSPNLIVLSLHSDEGTTLRFHRKSDGSIVDSHLISSSKISTELSETTEFLMCTTGEEPVLVEYDTTNQNIEIKTVQIHIRDFELVPDDLAIGENPTSLTDEHKYNLLNAGWYAERRLKSSGSDGDCIADYENSENEFPNNAEIAVLGLTANEDGKEEFSSETLKEVVLGNSEAPRGHYIYSISAFDRNTRLASPSTDGSPTTTTTDVSTTSVPVVVTDVIMGL